MSAIRCDVGVSGTAVSELLIEGVLNARSRNMVQHVFSSQYVDHNPVPGLAYGLGGIHQLLQFLSHDDVDIVFTLERSVSDTDSVAVQIFGEGTVRGNPLRQAIRIFGWPDVHIMHLRIGTISMFSLSAGLLAARWGAVSVKRAVFA